MKFRVLLMAGLIVWSGAESNAIAETPRGVTFRTRTMGTIASLTLITSDSTAVADLALQALLSLHHTDSLMTNWTQTSETARVNRLAGSQTVILDPDLNRVLAVAGQVGVASAGTFDITVEPLVRLWGFLAGEPAVPTQEAVERALVPTGWRQLEHDYRAGTIRFLHPDTRIDLGGVAKGYGVDRVVAVLRNAGVVNALIDLSGNMVAMGSPPGKAGWTLGIMDPAGKHEYLGRLVLRDGAVATSGNYLQYVMDPGDPDGKLYGHILDPRTGWPAVGMSSATVIAPDATTADAWATAFIVMDGQQARAVAAEHVELQVVLIEQAIENVQVIWVEEDLRKNFAVRDDLDEAVEVRYF